LVSSVTSQTFGSYLLVPGTQLNKQQLTTSKVSVGQSWKTNGATHHLRRVGLASWRWVEMTGLPTDRGKVEMEVIRFDIPCTFNIWLSSVQVV